jgi:hypothetical protein
MMNRYVALLTAATILAGSPAQAADPSYPLPLPSAGSAVAVAVGISDQAGHVVPTSSANPLPVMEFGDRKISIPTVTASAYASGNDVGGLNAVAFQGSGPPLLVEAVSLKSLSGQVPALTVYVFDSLPQHSTFTDKGTFTLDATTAGTDGVLDIDRLLLAPFALTLAAQTGSAVSFAESASLARLPHAGATGLWYALVSGSIFTPGSTTDIHVGFQVAQTHQ